MPAQAGSESRRACAATFWMMLRPLMEDARLVAMQCVDYRCHRSSPEPHLVVVRPDSERNRHQASCDHDQMCAA